MDLADIKIHDLYRYSGGIAVALALLPGGPREDDPHGPQHADMIMIRWVGDDHKFVVDPADLEPLDQEES